MLKKHMAACLVVTAFAAAPAFAQTSPAPSAPTDRPTASGSGTTTSGSPAMQPGASGALSTNSSAMSQGGATPGQFMTQMQSSQMMASDLIGTRVVSTNNESIGDINDVIVDRNAQVMAVVVGVGGFLGIGEKDVAVPFGSLEFASNQQASATDNNVATTGSTASNPNMATNNAPAANSNASSSNEPDRVILRMTKAELQAAPAFKANADADANRSNTGTTGTTNTTPQK
ncbi:PRC-barrel domain-containing protein [Microvirga sp. ACRRW]|uniref:PRC-barrel domain-containing protein n=1 Tax=Microvirga sp. ACRRW TaxID=2918205 RepID=UPI001EF5A554|nr:PRC-barrel domain-containing protein [Microvirga sp. ACRRW]MCG7392475.1 PRC-barrel domain-containing protein [Microvirga sp. ACRRW]